MISFVFSFKCHTNVLGGSTNKVSLLDPDSMRHCPHFDTDFELGYVRPTVTKKSKIGRTMLMCVNVRLKSVFHWQAVSS